MKNLTKIFMAVAVAMFAFSCVNDTTDDIAVKVGGKTTLAISLGGGNRTALGEAADGVYPITWAEGDQITVNGETSEPLAAADADTANAVFTFNAELAAPYCVAYPAAEANQVVFAAEQEYAEGTFANGAATMYGYATNGNIKLNHLTGVLKIGVVCDENVDIFDAPVIQSVKISTIDRAPIAGAFNIDFATGAVTATDDAVSVINYSIDEKLSQSPTYLHIAVPAGVYNELYVTLEDSNGGVMYATITADDKKPLAAGKVREFTTPIVYVATDEVENLVVRDYSSLLTIKETIEAAEEMGDTATLAKDITFVADVEINPAMTTTIGTWSPINAPNYKGTVKGNGYAINGLTKPLFNVTAASFKGLHLNVNIEETENPNVGAFARQIVATTNAPVVEGCSVSGSITVNTDVEFAQEDVYTDASCGGVTGIAMGVVFKDCINKATINTNQISTTKKTYPGIAGIVGYANVANEIFVSFTNCHNSGAINFNDATGKIPPCMSGIVGIYHGKKAIVTFDNCSNSGDFTVSENAKTRDCNIGGIIGMVDSKTDGDNSNKKTITFVNNTVNSGNIYVKGTVAATAKIGGIVGYSYQFTTIELNGTTINSGSKLLSGSAKNAYIGGFLGYQNSGSTFNINNFATNTASGTIDFSGSATETCNCGGIVGFINRNDKNYTPSLRVQYKTVVNDANITVSGTTGQQCRIGGFVGYTFNTNTYFNHTGKFVNNGVISMTKSAVLTGAVCVAGATGNVNGYNMSAGSNHTGQIVNNGEVRFEGEAKSNLFIGGVFGCLFGNATTLELINVGKIVATGKFNTESTCKVGGVIAQIGSSEYNERNIQKCQSYCDIIAYNIGADGKVTPYTQVGMISGTADDAFGTCSNSKLGGRIATTGTADTPTWTTLTESNYLDYVIGDRGYTTYTNVTLLTSKDAIEYGNFGNKAK